MASITLKGVSKHFGSVQALRSLDLVVNDGEFFTLLGPSGCGKTTLLRMIAGLEKCSGGTIHLNGRDITPCPPKDRDIALVFQDYALYPHLTVRQNLAFPLEAKRVGRREIEAKVAEVARRLQLDGLLDRRPKQLSGGQQQRVALGRAMVRSPQVFLMDEPLSNLDAKLRVDMRVELKRLQKDLGVTTIYVTHDQEEALTMSDRIAVMNQGVVQHCATPAEIYRRPANRWVGSFVGSPAMNMIDVVVETEGGATWLTPIADRRVRLPSPGTIPPGPMTIGVRPEHFALLSEPGLGVLPGRVHVVELVGDHFILTVRTACGLVTVKSRDENAPEMEAEVFLSVDAHRIHLFASGSGERIEP